MSDLNRSVYTSREGPFVGGVKYFDGPDDYEEHDVARCAKAMEISGGVLYADESGEYYIECEDFIQLLNNPQLFNTRVPV